MADMTHPVQVGGNHYGMDYDVWSLTMDTHMPFSQGNILKYYTRAPSKNGLEDAEKCLCYLDGLANHDSSVHPCPIYPDDYIQWCHECMDRFLAQLVYSEEIKDALHMIGMWHLLETDPVSRSLLYSRTRDQVVRLVQSFKESM